MTYAAPLTPAGRAAIATVAVIGPQAREVVQSRFCAAAGGDIAQCQPGRVLFGRFRGLAGEEELVVGITAADRMEIHCHGGPAATAAILAALCADGCQRCEWQELAPAFESDVLAVEARVALAAASTERTASLLLAQYQGALRDEAQRIGDQIAIGNLSAAELALQALLDRAELGRHLTRPWRVVLAGAPNVGKSSLVNALVGYRRSIVFNQPGTTRDVVTATTAVDGWPIELSDTAGLHATGDALERVGIERARKRLAEADLALVVFESPAAWTAGDADLVASLPASLRRIVLWNKSDLGATAEGNRPAGLSVSALTGEGLETLLAAISRVLVPHPPAAGVAIPFTERQIASLAAAKDALAAGNAAAASRELLGLISTQDSI